MKFLNAEPVASYLAAALPPYDFYADTLRVKNYGSYTDPNRGTTIGIEQDVEANFDAVRTRLMTDPAGVQEMRVDVTLDLTALGALFKNICTIPPGSKVKVAILQILQLVVAGGTTVKLGIGPHAGTVNLFGNTGDLLKNTQIGKVPADAASLIASSTGIDLCAVTSAGNAAGDTNISAGMVRVVIVYDTPAIIPNV